MLKTLQNLPKKTLLIIISILLILVVGGSILVYSYVNNSNTSNLSNNSKSVKNLDNSTKNTESTNSNIFQNRSSSHLSNTNLSSLTNSEENNTTSQNNPDLVKKTENIKLETAILDECDLVINYNPDKYYVVESENIYNVGTKIEIREKNIASINDSLLLYQCNSDNYNFGNVSGEPQKLYPSSNFKIPLFASFFWDKTAEAGVMEFPGNVELRTKEEFELDWFKVHDNPNFQAGIKTKDARMIFHQMTFRNNPTFWNGKDLQLTLKTQETKETKPILSYEEFEKLSFEEKNEDAKRVKKFTNWNKIKFDGKINKISDIPANLLDKYGIPQFGFRFYKGVVFWTGYRSNAEGFEGYLAKSQENNSKKVMDKKEDKVSNQGIIAYDGTNIVEITDEFGKEITNNSGSSIVTYYLSTLIKDGIGYNFGQACGGWGCFVDWGFFINFDKGEYWISKEGLDTENNNKILDSQKLTESYLDHDFKVWKGIGNPRISGNTGYKIHRNGKIYGTFQKYNGQVENGFPKSEGTFVVEADGQNYKFLYLAKNACSNPMVVCSDNLAFNSRGNLVYYGEFFEMEEMEKQGVRNNEQNSQKAIEYKTKFIEQDFASGKVLQEETSFKNDQVFQKFGISKIN